MEIMELQLKVMKTSQDMQTMIKELADEVVADSGNNVEAIANLRNFKWKVGSNESLFIIERAIEDIRNR